MSIRIRTLEDAIDHARRRLKQAGIRLLEEPYFEG